MSYKNKIQTSTKVKMKKLDKMFTQEFIRLPRPFIRLFNLNTAVMLSEIYSEYMYWKEKNLLDPGGWFFSTVENIYYNTGLSKHQQLSACKELISYGIIKTKYHGLPKKRYFKFDLIIINRLYQDFQLNSNQSKEEIETDSSTRTFQHSF